ncbi:MAG: S49 family peptidase [Brevinema sp.]
MKNELIMMNPQFNDRLFGLNEEFQLSLKMQKNSLIDSRAQNEIFIFGNESNIQGDTMYITISGVLLYWDEEWMIKDLFTTYSFIERQLEQAYTNDTVKNVIFLVNSPGGYALKMLAVAEQIAELSSVKNTTALVQGFCCSAAYMLSANCNEIIAVQGSLIGSIGTYMAVIDDHKRYESLGMKIYNIGNPKGKIYAREGVEIDKEALQSIEQRVAESYDEVIKSVSSRISPEKITILNAQTFTTSVALEHGLIDRIVSPKEILNSQINKEDDMSTPDNPQIPAHEPTNHTESADIPKIVEEQITAHLSDFKTQIQEMFAEGLKQIQESQQAISEESRPYAHLPHAGVLQTGADHFHQEAVPTQNLGQQMGDLIKSKSTKSTLKEVNI